MKNYFMLLLAVLMAAGCSAKEYHAEPKQDIPKKSVYRVFFLAGQSNMSGCGNIQELPERFKHGVPGVKIFHGSICEDRTAVDGKGIWEDVMPGHGGSEFRSDGKTNRYGKCFGPEIGLAARLKELYPNDKIALVKYAKGATSMDAVGTKYGCWDPNFKLDNGINQYDHFIATWKHAAAVSDIDGDGREDTLVPAGIFWMQGESDANYKDPKVSQRYEGHLTSMIAAMRNAIGVHDLPFVIGRIAISADAKVKPKNPHRYPYGKVVRQAQKAIADRDSHVLMISTDDLGWSDLFHYSSDGYIQLGTMFADAYGRLTVDRFAFPNGQRYTIPMKPAKCIERLEKGENITIVTLGTSLTGGKWRWVDVMQQWLNNRYPGQVTIKNMGVGASASMTVPIMKGN